MFGKFYKKEEKKISFRFGFFVQVPYKIGIWFLPFLMLMFSCQKEEQVFEYNVLVTEQPIVIGEEKHSEVSLSARVMISNDDEIIKKGFVYGKDSKPKIGQNQEAKLGKEESNSKEFAGTIKRPLYPNTTYFVRSFLQTEGQITYGNQVSFEYTRSQPATLESLSPSSGSWGDTILIKGKLLGDSTENTAVYFGNYRAKCLYSRVDSAAVVVPDSVSVRRSQVYVLVYGQASGNTLSFELEEPVIHSLSATEGGFPDVVVINGENFSPDFTKLRLGDRPIDPVEVSDNEIKWRVPFSNIEITEDLYVSQFEKDYLAGGFKSLSQNFDGVSKSEVWLYDTITINATNIDFSSIENCEVFMEDLSVPIVEKGDGFIICRVEVGYKSVGDEVFNVKVGYNEGKHRYNQTYHELFSFELQQKDFEFELISEGPFAYMELLEGKGSGFTNGAFYFENLSTGETGTKDFSWKEYPSYDTPVIDKEFYLNLSRDMVPGNYEIWIQGFGRTTPRRTITIAEPEITSVANPTFARSSEIFSVTGNFLPVVDLPTPLSSNSYSYVRHLESGRITPTRSIDRYSFDVRDVIGAGRYKYGIFIDDVPYEYDTEISINDFFTYETTYDNNRYSIVHECFGFEINNKIYAGFGSGEPVSIDLISGETNSIEPMGEESGFRNYLGWNDHPYDFFNGKVYSLFNDKVCSFNASEEKWEQETYEFGTDTILSICTVDNQLYAFSYRGNVYIKEDTWSYLGYFEALKDNNFRTSYYHDGSIYFVGRYGVKIFSLDTRSFTDEIVANWQGNLSYFTGFISFEYNGDIYLIYKNVSYTGSRVWIKRFSIPLEEWVEINPYSLPENSFYYDFVTNETGSVYMLNDGYVYSFNP